MPRRSLVPAVGVLVRGIVAAALAGATLEAGLRLMPQAVPPSVLAEFPDDLRSAIAHGRPVITRDQMRAVPRDDGGPELLVFRPSVEVRSYAPDPGMVGDVLLDTEGFCDPLPDPERGASLVAVGDSFTFCTTVRAADTWTARLGRRLRVSAEDLGVPRLGLYEYLEVLKQFGLPKRPRVVVMNVYEGNDLRDAVLYWEARANPDAAEAREQTPSATSRLAHAIRASAFGRHSYAASVLAGGLLAWKEPPAASDLARREGLRPRDVNFRYRLEFPTSSIAFNPENADRNEVVYADLLARSRVTLDLFDRALEEYAALARHYHFTPVLAYTPSAYSVYGDVVRFEDRALEPLMQGYSRSQRAFFARRATALGLRFVDLTEPLRVAARRAGDRELLYFPSNVHLSPAGHRVIARALEVLLGDSRQGRER